MDYTKTYSKYKITAKNIENLKDTEVIELISRYQKYKDQNAKNRVIEAHIKYVFHLAESHLRKRDVCGKLFQDLEDFVQQGMIGLLKAIERFDVSRTDVCFATYAASWIKKYFYEYEWSQNQLRISEKISLNMSRLSKVEREFYTLYSRMPTEKELCEETGYTVKMVRNIIKARERNRVYRIMTGDESPICVKEPNYQIEDDIIRKVDAEHYEEFIINFLRENGAQELDLHIVKTILQMDSEKVNYTTIAKKAGCPLSTMKYHINHFIKPCLSKFI